MDNSTKNIIIFALAFALVISILMAVHTNSGSKVKDTEITRLQFTRDSIIQGQINVVKEEAKLHQHRADSLQTLADSYTKKIESNKKEKLREVKKISKLTPLQRNKVLDSIFDNHGVK